MALPRTVAVASSSCTFRKSLTSLSTINYKFQLCHSSISLHCPRLQSTVACFSEQQNHSIRSPNLVALEYADLNLPHICVVYHSFTLFYYSLMPIFDFGFF
ncbi:unnamed protein product [Amaranthus hypochondriacus]